MHKGHIVRVPLSVRRGSSSSSSGSAAICVGFLLDHWQTNTCIIIAPLSGLPLAVPGAAVSGTRCTGRLSNAGHLLIGSLGTQRGIAPRNMIRKCATNGANLYFPLSPEDYYSAALRSPKSVPDSQQISSSFRPIPPSAIMSIPPRSESVVWQRQRMSRGMRRRCCDASAKQSSQHHLRNSLTRFPSPLLTPSFASLLFSDRIGLEVDRRSPSIHLLQSSVAK